MFLVVSGRHVGAHTDGHQHGVSIQISVNLGKKFLQIFRIRKIYVTRILARVFAYLPSFISQILDFIFWPVLFFYIDLFWIAWHWKPTIVVKQYSANASIRSTQLGNGKCTKISSFNHFERIDFTKGCLLSPHLMSHFALCRLYLRWFFSIIVKQYSTNASIRSAQLGN